MKGNSMSAEANVGVVGLAAMGGSLARNLAHHGNKVAVFNRTYARTEKLMNRTSPSSRSRSAMRAMRNSMMPLTLSVR